MLQSGKQLGQWIFTIVISLVWLINGLYCKILGMVPRHEQIVASILGATHAHTFTICIGIAEVITAIWVLSRRWLKLCTYSQMMVVAVMNILEALLVPQLLLYGYGNLFFAVIFILIVWAHQQWISVKI